MLVEQLEQSRGSVGVFAEVVWTNCWSETGVRVLGQGSHVSGEEDERDRALVLCEGGRRGEGRRGLFC